MVEIMANTWYIAFLMIYIFYSVHLWYLYHIETIDNNSRYVVYGEESWPILDSLQQVVVLKLVQRNLPKMGNDSSTELTIQGTKVG